MPRLPLVPGRHEQTRTMPSFLSCWRSSKQCLFSIFYFGHNCKQHWLHTLRKASRPFIYLSNQYFVLLQYSRSYLTHFHSLYRKGAAPAWEFCSSYGLHVLMDQCGESGGPRKGSRVRAELEIHMGFKFIILKISVLHMRKTWWFHEKNPKPTNKHTHTTPWKIMGGEEVSETQTALPHCLMIPAHTWIVGDFGSAARSDLSSFIFWQCDINSCLSWQEQKKSFLMTSFCKAFLSNSNIFQINWHFLS